MASWSRAHAIKAALVAGFLLILLNLLGSRWDSTPIGLPRMGTTQWPKRTRASSERLVLLHVPSPDRNATNESGSNNHNPLQATISNSPADPSNLERTNLLNINLTNTRASESPKSQKDNESQPATDGVILSAAASLPMATGAQLSTAANATAEISSNDTSPSSSSKHSTNLSSNSENLIAGNGSSSRYGKKMVPGAHGQQQRRNESMNLVQTDNNTGAIDTLLRRRGQSSCPPIPPNLDGPIEVDVSYESISSIEQKLAPKLQPGGQFTPRECSARDRVAVIVPYRDREQHLPVFLKNIHSFLMKQQVEYGVYIVEQSAGSQFNRAALMNVGFVEAMKQKNWDCMVFHDVDLLPMDDRNLYTCPDQPRHMSVAVDTFGFKLPYSTIFGGVSAMTVKQFRTVNGFSNSFWGWGGEDDDMSNRLKHVGFHIARYPINIARYTMLTHKKEKANPKRYEKLVTGAKRFDSDGLNSLHYQLVNLIRKPLFTWVHVEISADSS